MQTDFLRSALANLNSTEARELEDCLNQNLRSGLALTEIAKSYNQIVQDTLSEQVFFRQNKRYRHASFADVAKNVYFNPAYMRLYMTGLAVTQFFWPNHLEIKRFFEQSIPKQESGLYLEIGPGHGLGLRYVLGHTNFKKVVGLDISPTSLKMTKEAIADHPHMSRVTLIESDFLAYQPESAVDAIVMGEVLEHVEQPLLFLKKIREISKPSAFIFVTTCCNAPAIDHIYLFKSVSEVESLCQEAKLKIENAKCLPYSGTTMTETVERRLPLNMALVLRHG